jgi:hypothetical protein
MIIINREWKSGDAFGGVMTKAYADIEAQYLNFKPGIRVLPAESYDEPSTPFYLKARYEAGEKASFPDGGFEVYGQANEIRSFDLDQVIVHPYELNQMKFFTKQITVEKKTQVSDPNAPKRGRGRPPKEGEKKPKAEYVSTGRKRGRPSTGAVKKQYIPTGKPRGRAKKVSE